MTIYRIPKVYADSDVTSPLRPDVRAETIAPKPGDGSSPWAHLRKASPLNAMLPQSATWARELPDNVRPVNLIEQFPRIVNLIVLEWNRPATLCKHFEDLLHDKRGGRKGFPAAVRSELAALREYYYLEVMAGKSSAAKSRGAAR